jgi:hypothetical protein
MDDSVVAAIAKWPNVPAVFGWLKLTARGEWRLRGERIGNAALRDFIGRNYAHDERGRWYFQNGPQRVYVELEATPWVVRVDPAGALSMHTGARPTACTGAALLDDARFVLDTELGPALVDDRDAAIFVRALTDPFGLPLNERGIERWLDGKDEAFVAPARLRVAGAPCRIERLRFEQLEVRYGFVRTPAP